MEERKRDEISRWPLGGATNWAPSNAISKNNQLSLRGAKWWSSSAILPIHISFEHQLRKIMFHLSSTETTWLSYYEDERLASSYLLPGEISQIALTCFCRRLTEFKSKERERERESSNYYRLLLALAYNKYLSHKQCVTHRKRICCVSIQHSFHVWSLQCFALSIKPFKVAKFNTTGFLRWLCNSAESSVQLTWLYKSISLLYLA